MDQSKVIGKEKPSINVVRKLSQLQLGKKQTSYFKAYERTTKMVNDAKEAAERARESLERFYDTEEGQNLNLLQAYLVNQSIVDRFENDIQKTKDIQRTVLQKYKYR